jgi:hypothetical protein
VSHCDAGCGSGELVGVSVKVGLLAFRTTGTVVFTSACAYLVNYPTLLGLAASLRVELPASMTHFCSGGDWEVSSATGSAVSTGVDSECPTPIGSTGEFHGLTHAFSRV